ncbi:MAG: hypothetical protein LBR80_18440, partial [Deltaproteobacteria bacterium]|nr:hypothetical protein [Deltaproteobacteria bacterium]
MSQLLRLALFPAVLSALWAGAPGALAFDAPYPSFPDPFASSDSSASSASSTSGAAAEPESGGPPPFLRWEFRHPSRHWHGPAVVELF